jgi:hypothetical protein
MRAYRTDPRIGTDLVRSRVLRPPAVGFVVTSCAEATCIDALPAPLSLKEKGPYASANPSETCNWSVISYRE